MKNTINSVGQRFSALAVFNHNFRDLDDQRHPIRAILCGFGFDVLDAILRAVSIPKRSDCSEG